ncbi:MAG TPA: DUF1501 domain-containing protein [Pirellulales bacterium]|jgi:hypothetical protein|nr:DUF1501 domain-containing protein [Pirellulales bacterium]
MLTILGPPERRAQFCDRVSRRNFLKIGSLGLSGLTLPRLLAADERGGRGRSQKSVILIYLVGGPPHQDILDLKPKAPAEIAGPFRPIRTNVPSIEICEHLPRLAGMMDKLVPIRSIVGAQDDHDAAQCYTGRHPKIGAAAGGWPQLGSVVSKLQGPTQPSVPPFVSVCYTTTHGPYNEPGPGFLGLAHDGFRPLGPTRDDMLLRGVTYDQLGHRKALLSSLDRLRRDVDHTGKMQGLDAFTQQAVGILTSSKLADALDLSKEDPRTVERYGTGDEKIHIDENGAPRVPQSMLIARRLVEAGARVVTLNYSKWDWHGHPYGSCFDRCREDLQVFDKAFPALIQDLHDRGLDKDVTVAVWGEFGRTPMINKNVGRDHWPRVACGLLAGGGMRTGQVIGATDRLGGEAIERPVTFGDLFATLYHNLGIDVATTTLPDLRGRPQYLVEDNARPLAELV